MWEREKSGQFIYDNFRAVSETADSYYKKRGPIREKLGDLAHINFTNLRKFSLLNHSPNFAMELFKIGKLEGYYDGELSIRATPLEKKRDKYAETEKFLSIFKHLIKDGDCVGAYEKLGCGIFELKKIEEKSGTVTFTLDENTSYPVKSTKKMCYEDLGELCGICESLTGRFYSGVETRCHSIGDKKCEFEMHPVKKYIEPELEEPTKEETDDILNVLVEDITHKRKHRKKLGDYTYIAYDQCMNYLLTHASKGHEVLAKYHGALIGEKLLEKKEYTKPIETLEYLKEIFEYMRVGLLTAEYKPEAIIVKMEESLYSAGVKNIGMKLDTHISGIIEGALKQSTGQNWSVDETRCIANGDEYCEFRCKIR